MGQDLPLRQLTGPNQMAMLGPFGELEAAVAVGELRIGGALFDAAGPIPALYPGVVVGMSGSSEAGSNFTVQITINGTPDTGVTMTVNAAKDIQELKPSEFVPFVAGDTIGTNVVVDTTSKDAYIFLWVIYDLSGKG